MPLVASLFLVVAEGQEPLVASLLLVAMPGAPSSVLAARIYVVGAVAWETVPGERLQ